MNDNKMPGVVIDAGHGGNDPGAVASGLKEKDFDLKAAIYMYDRFKQLGIPVAITRTTDETLTREDRINRIMSAFGNDPNVILISNHVNSGGGEGAEVIYALRNNSSLAASVLDEIAKKGQIIRKYYQRRLTTDTAKDYYYIIRDTDGLQSLIVEYGFIDNQEDVNRLQKNLLDYAEAVVKAVAGYKGVPYTKPTGIAENVYIVQAGDSLWKIADQFEITVDALKAANGLTTNIISIGQQLLIPTVLPEPSVPGEYVVYTVQAGDSLWQIANKYNVSVDDIVELNQLDTNLLSVNQQLLIPNQKEEPITSEITYVVKAGDSLWNIANQYGITVDELKKANNLINNNLSIGQELIIPTPLVEGQPTEETETIENIIYIVKSGDSLYSIAKKYGVTVDELKSINNLTTSLLSIGQQLTIPSSSNYLTYYVQMGDNLYSIAAKFNTTLDKIKQLNNLTSNNLSIGQVLLIP